ncbi:hypothetical protein [Streptomyces sp. CAU 1734]|uniref:hypothetical protein n=1 Tax=Streptomyces sp. CAU 1734 TaxID=3140360 RepID=UPI003260D229
MGWTVLYIAFGVVALWLLGEVLLQYKARLRWRLLAFGGFVGVVLGVLIPSVLVIALGAITFAVGQTYVTLSFRRGFSTGWAIGGRPGASRRRKAGAPEPSREPALEISGLEETSAIGTGDGFPSAGDAGFPAGPVPESVYEPLPMPDDTAGYGVYTDAAWDAVQQDRHPQQDSYDAGRQDQYAPAGQDAYDPYYGAPQPAAAQGEYDAGQPQYTGYADPFAGGGRPDGGQYGGADAYDSFGNQQPYNPDPYYGQHSATDTPPGGVWVPQQRYSESDRQPPHDYGDEPNEQQYRH